MFRGNKALEAALNMRIRAGNTICFEAVELDDHAHEGKAGPHFDLVLLEHGDQLPGDDGRLSSRDEVQYTALEDTRYDICKYQAVGIFAHHHYQNQKQNRYHNAWQVDCFELHDEFVQSRERYWSCPRVLFSWKGQGC